ALHRLDKLAHAVDIGDLGFLESDAEPALDLQRKRHPFQGVDAEVQLQAGLEAERPARIALLEELPDLGRQRLVQEDPVCLGQLCRLALQLSGQRLPIELRQQETPELAEPRAGQRLAHEYIAGET